MIPASSYHAMYSDYQQREVVAWDDEGAPLVAGKTGLVPASAYSGFLRIEQAKKIVASVPGGGWMIAGIRGDGTGWTEPVIAWNIRDTGEAVAVMSDARGEVTYEVDADVYQGLIIYHPDATERPPLGAPADIEGRPSRADCDRCARRRWVEVQGPHPKPVPLSAVLIMERCPCSKGDGQAYAYAG